MAYQFKSTEQNVERATEFETKTLLYLLGVDKISTKINIVFVDCFNDVTGSDKNCQALWDFQSKGVSSLTPSKIGTALITLFENYISGLNFLKYALFMPQPKETYLVNAKLREFDISNFNGCRDQIRDGLKKEHARRCHLEGAVAEDLKRIEEFLDSVVFVADFGEKEDYVKNLVSFKEKELKSKQFYAEIFNEIRSVQASKKAISIHNKIINNIIEALAFEKHFLSKDISILIINRLVGVDLFNRVAIPIDFLTEIEGMDKNDVKDLIQYCNSRISRAVFDKNNKRNFWTFLEKSISKIMHTPEMSSKDIYKLVTINDELKFRHLSGSTGIYLISLLKEGLYQ